MEVNFLNDDSDLAVIPRDSLSLPNVSTTALSEIISRSLAHIQASRIMAVPERRPGEEREFEIAPGVKIVMCWIPPGEFLMGSPEDEVGREAHHYHFIETQHLVRITLGFWLGKYPVTQAQWEAVMGSNPSCLKAIIFRLKRSVGTIFQNQEVSWRGSTTFPQQERSFLCQPRRSGNMPAARVR